MSSQIKVNTRARWVELNPRLLVGELAQEADTGNLKIGNGKQSWNDLPYHGCPGYWGSFWDPTSQIAAAINTPQAILLRAGDSSSKGVTVASDSRITVAYPGVYSLTFSVQLSNGDNSIHDVNIWLRKNDSGTSGDVPNSDSRFSVIAKRGNLEGNVIGAVNFVLPLVAKDYLELMWATTSLAAYIHAEPSGATHPAIPGVICTITQVASA
jgi:hypothetical protein